MSLLIGHGSVRFETAKEEFSKSKQFPDLCESYIDMACFDFHQAMEFYLKGLVELQGKKYVENHDLRAQLNKLDAPDALKECLDLIRMNAATFNSWETSSRYDDSFISTLEDIELAIKICTDLKKYCMDIVLIQEKT